MKIFKNFLVLLIGIIAFSSVNVSAQNVSVKNTRTLEQQIFKELIKLPYYGVFDHIAYEVKGDTVILYGKINNAMNKKQAEREVRDIAGVRNVVNNIEILPPSPFDNSIRYRTLRTFANTGGLYRYLWEPNPSVRIIVDRGHITLEGYVANRGDYNLMNILANGVPGVFTVRNNLKIGKADF
ncbi:MAG TPA: BON domain-containing protein [Pyrinomonadaceae bacterium]|nr:BON domain-containing protein [Pyrinomonadaceae bacterium]